MASNTGGSGGSAGPGGASIGRGATSAATSSTPPGPEVNIFIDPLTGQVHNPEFQDTVGAAYDYARERYGSKARINVRPRTGGPA